MIQFPDFDVSCFQLVSGSTFEESILTNSPNVILLDVSPAPDLTTGHLVKEEQKPQEPDPVTTKETTRSSSSSIPEETSGPSNHSVTEKIESETESPGRNGNLTMEVTDKSAVSIPQDTMNNILLGKRLIRKC